MNNQELIDYIVANSDLKRKDAAESVKLAVQAVRYAVGRGGSCVVAGLGTFVVTRMAARVRLHPVTQLPINVPAKKKPKFKPAKSFDDMVNGRL